MNRKGLTLLEVIVATLILALVMGGMANLFVSGKRHILRSRARMVSAELGKRFLDPLQMDVRQDEWGSNCLSNGTDCSGNETIDGINYTPTYNISNVSTTLRRVNVTINWTAPAP